MVRTLAVIDGGRELGQLRVDTGNGLVVRTAAYHMGTHVAIPVDIRTHDGEYARMIVEVSPGLYDKAVRFARAQGLDHLRLTDLVERFTGHRPLVTLDARPLLPPR